MDKDRPDFSPTVRGLSGVFLLAVDSHVSRQAEPTDKGGKLQDFCVPRRCTCFHKVELTAVRRRRARTSDEAKNMLVKAFETQEIDETCLGDSITRCLKKKFVCGQQQLSHAVPSP